MKARQESRAIEYATEHTHPIDSVTLDLSEIIESKKNAYMAGDNDRLKIDTEFVKVWLMHNADRYIEKVGHTSQYTFSTKMIDELIKAMEN